VYYSREAYLVVGRTLADAGFSVLPYHHEVVR
jgi:predicted membrane-bound spermidine synthase